MSLTESLTVHHLENSRSQRVLWLLEELELPYEMVQYARHPKTLRAPPELRQLHPLGKAPIVTVGDDVVLAESGAILEYFVEATGKLAPAAGTAARQRYRYWMHFAEGSMMAPLLVKLVMSRVRSAPVPFFVRPVAKGIAAKVEDSFSTPEITRLFDFVEQTLVEQPYFAGESFSAADIQMSYGVEVGMQRGDGQDRPRTAAWLEQVQARPAFQRAVERGGRNRIPGS